MHAEIKARAKCRKRRLGASIQETDDISQQRSDSREQTADRSDDIVGIGTLFPSIFLPSFTSTFLVTFFCPFLPSAGFCEMRVQNVSGI
jgi:hypothetical protein